MVDFSVLVINGPWILGLAVLLATASWARWVALEEGIRPHVALGRRGIRQIATLGMVLFCAGLAVTGRVWWERVLWGLLAAISLVWAVPSLKLPGFREGGSP